jgi:hypothetical protein
MHEDYHSISVSFSPSLVASTLKIAFEKIQSEYACAKGNQS